MKIRSVQAHLLSFPLPDPKPLPYYGGERLIVKRDAMLIRIETESGAIGYGPGAADEHWKAVIENEIAAFLVGRLAADPDALRVQFEMRKPDPEIYKIYCCVEVALYDLIGKLKKLPVSELLGGRIRDRILLYGSAGMYMSPEGYAREAQQVHQMGFKAYKMRPANGPDADVEAVRQMREATSPDFELMIDAHSWWRMGDRSYSAETVADVAQRMSEHEITWLEEPLPPDNHEAYREMKRKDIVPLASGEHEPDEDGFLDLLDGPCVDYVQADVVCQGGYALARRLFTRIGQHDLRFAFHSWGTGLEVLAAAQIGVCWPETVVEWLEYPCYSTAEMEFMYPFPLASEILKQPLQIEQGNLIVPSGPGLGIEVNEDVIARYPWIPGPWSFFTLTSPKETFAVTSDHSVKWAGKP